MLSLSLIPPRPVSYNPTSNSDLSSSHDAQDLRLFQSHETQLLQNLNKLLGCHPLALPSCERVLSRQRPQRHLQPHPKQQWPATSAPPTPTHLLPRYPRSPRRRREQHLPAETKRAEVRRRMDPPTRCSENIPSQDGRRHGARGARNPRPARASYA